MDSEQFNRVLAYQLDQCQQTLGTKAAEYATEDRLYNFKVAAKIQNTTTRQALAGMMAKHTVSIFDLCRESESAPMEVWNEKITDHINYLILLRALVVEEAGSSFEQPPLFDNVLFQQIEHLKGLS